MISVTCPACDQFPVAKDHQGICPHLFRGKPCPGGRAAPKLKAVVERAPQPKSPSIEAGKAKRAAGMKAKTERRDAAVLALLPATPWNLARALRITIDSVRTSCRRQGAILDPGQPTDRSRMWRLPALAEAAK